MSSNVELHTLHQTVARVCLHALLDIDGLLDIGFDTNIRECDIEGVTNTIHELKDLIVHCGYADVLRGPPFEEGADR